MRVVLAAGALAGLEPPDPRSGAILGACRPDEPTLDALGDRRLGDLHRITPTAAEEADQLQEELAASLAHLQRVDAAYWEREWRREHKGLGIYPEEHLWRASHGYLDLLAATRAAGSI
jgi:hypothetical protein